MQPAEVDDVECGQKAPSAKRCIKTTPAREPSVNRVFVRKHRAPKGALRLQCLDDHSVVFARQKAPSAKRCIKTFSGLLILST